MVQAYCVKDRKMVDMKDPKEITLKNGRSATQGTCPTCGTKVTRIGGRRQVARSFPAVVSQPPHFLRPFFRLAHVLLVKPHRVYGPYFIAPKEHHLWTVTTSLLEKFARYQRSGRYYDILSSVAPCTGRHAPRFRVGPGGKGRRPGSLDGRSAYAY